MRNTHLLFAALTSSTVLTLTACAGSDPVAETAAPIAEAVVVHDAWVKAAETGMSAAFGGVENTGDTDAVVTAATSEASTALELHETVENEAGEMVMREKENGFTIASGETLALEPGGDHIMLMDLVEPLEAGQEVVFTLTFSDDSSLEFSAPVKDYSGANENYDGGDGEGDDEHSGHDMDHDMSDDHMGEE